jgi:hypothetical protein
METLNKEIKMKKLLVTAIIFLLPACTFAVDITFTSSTSFGEGYVWDEVRVKNNGTVVNMTGGRILEGLNTANASTVNISGGSIKGNTQLPVLITSNDSSIINMSGGIINGSFYINGPSCVNILGGEITGAISKLYPGATLNISGGNMNFTDFNIYGNVNIYGGLLNIDNFSCSGGTINIYGYGFIYNSTNKLLTGYLSDNTPFTIAGVASYEYPYINCIPEPISALLFSFGLLALRKRK